MTKQTKQTTQEMKFTCCECDKKYTWEEDAHECYMNDIAVQELYFG